MKKLSFIQRFIQRRFSTVGSVGLHIIIFCCAMMCNVCFAQSGEWTWMKGNTGNSPPGVFGTQGVAAASNTPPGLYEPISWTDNQHNFWLFGGVHSGIYGDLWKYDVATNYWTWMTGTAGANVAGTYGTQGVSSPSNNPGSRGYGGLGWVDSSGNLWMFGGWGYDAIGTYGPLSDVWMYNVTTNEWTWMKGSTQGYQLGNYGTILVSSPTNDPGNRYEFNAGWTDENYNLWLFGGESQQIGSINLSDVWKYDQSLNEWTWMQGAAASAGYQSAVYGTLGVSSPLNTPGSRSVYCVSKDINGKFWMFGGYYSFSIPAFNDVWMFDPVSLEWTWMGGTTVQDDPGNYIALCDTTPQLPSSRYENRSNWTDLCGNLWMFGGVNNNAGAMTDLWVHNTATGKWIWVNGSSLGFVTPVYGTQGVPDPANIPGGRSGTLTWTDSVGNLWMFGGFDQFYNSKNDLWRFVLDTSCIALPDCNLFSAPSFLASDTELCEKFCIDFIDQSPNNPFAWQWLFPGGSPSSSTAQNPAQICYQLPGVYDVTLITSNANGNDTVTLFNYVTVNATPPFPTITQNGYTLTSSPAYSYQWQLNTIDIPGATNQSYDILQTGYYTILVGDSNGCKNSITQYIVISGTGDAGSDAYFSIYPNPSNGNFIVECLPAGQAGLNGLALGEMPPSFFSGNDISIEVVNALGQKVFSSLEKISIPASFRKEIQLKGLADGIYFFRVKSESFVIQRKIIVQDNHR